MKHVILAATAALALTTIGCEGNRSTRTEREGSPAQPSERPGAMPGNRTPGSASPLTDDAARPNPMIGDPQGVGAGQPGSNDKPDSGGGDGMPPAPPASPTPPPDPADTALDQRGGAEGSSAHGTFDSKQGGTNNQPNVGPPSAPGALDEGSRDVGSARAQPSR